MSHFAIYKFWHYVSGVYFVTFNGVSKLPFIGMLEANYGHSDLSLHLIPRYEFECGACALSSVSC